SNHLNHPVGKIVYTAMLDARGGIKCDLSITRLGSDRFWIVTGSRMACHDLAWIRTHAPQDGTVHITDLTSAFCCIGVWGPRARDVVRKVCETDLSNETFPYLTAKQTFIEEIPVIALRISYVGELGWEIYAPTEFGLKLWDILWAAGQEFDVAPVGNAAFDSLRLEKGYRLWGAELHTEYNPVEAGLGFAVRLKKGEFPGRNELLRLKDLPPQRKLCCIILSDPGIALMGKEPVFYGDAVVGHVTSANYGYSIGESIAYVYLPLAQATAGTPVDVYYFGQRHQATVVKEPLYDPANAMLKI
ncbi:MAG: aminomethyltransferase family protein, partial [Opitutaceae bacterium]